ncbi:Por secretion system C-terminal sorting domain-containing protein [Ekhidna lutea]|uniref:Por secretion system C-terminal sorting domain-containing protein n=1 Tax=Ekhidna lutea TaxID=447679 RepID=A0A239GLW1_EKHLU|nr:T9SS C-terminal target domain-containing protein [Ekhidna lutea]SNS70100.1 Por secretion system C-terminal sorting domain-containing protein [Ekhidna lutea]
MLRTILLLLINLSFINSITSQNKKIDLLKAVSESSNSILLEWKYLDDNQTYDQVIIEVSNGNTASFQPYDTITTFASEVLVKGISIPEANYFRLKGLDNKVISDTILAQSPGVFSTIHNARPDSIYHLAPITFLLGDDMYYGVPNDSSTIFYKYNLQDKKWTLSSNYPVSLERGGFVHDSVYYNFKSSQTHKYDLVNNSWSVINYTGGPTLNNSSEFEVVGNKLYYGFGVQNSQMPTHDLWSYDILNNQWTQIGNFSNELADEYINHIFVHDKTVFLVSHLEFIHSYDLLNEEFNYAIDSLPLKRNGPLYFNIDKDFYYYSTLGSGVNEELWKFDLELMQWNKINQNYNLYYSLAFASQSKAIFLGNGRSSAYDNIYIFDPSDPHKTDIFLVAEPENNLLNLSWEYYSNIGNSFIVEVSENNSNSFHSLDTLVSSIKSYQFIPEKENVSYFFRIKSISQTDTLKSNIAIYNSGPNWHLENSMPWKYDDYSNDLIPFRINDTYYFFQGNGTGSVRMVWSYELNDGSWSRAANFPGPARSQPSIFTVNGYAYVVSGDSPAGDSIINDVWKFDPSNNSWTQLNDFPGNHRRAGIGFESNNTGYVGLGYEPYPGNGDILKDLWKYNDTNDSWDQVESFPGTIGFRPNVASLNDSITYIGLGQNVNSTLWSYNSNSDKWELIIDNDLHHDFLNFVVVDGTLYTIEMDESGTLSRFDLKSNQLISLENFPTLEKPSIVFQNSNIIYALDEGGSMWSYTLIPLKQDDFLTSFKKVASIQLEWDNSIYTIGDTIIIDKSTENDQNFEPFLKVDNSINSFTDTLLVPGEQYFYRLRTFNVHGSSSYSYSNTTIPGIPAGPSELQSNLVDFTVNLNWLNNSTEYEHIEIERSVDSNDFVVIDTIGGNIQQYAELTDELEQNIRYRVRGFSKSGHTEYSNFTEVIIEILSLQDQPNVIIYPNPTSGRVNISTQENISEMQLQSINGRTIEKNNGELLDFSDLKSGLYILKCTIKGKVYDFRLIVN